MADVMGSSENQVTDSDTADVTVVHAAAISIEKSPDFQSIDYQGSATFTITVKNSGLCCSE